ncbi:hypothetical protein [Plantactinospora sp. CA-290183]|uniref:hypothetical protein n=1 Tax=Plantactinospora sp. CA-290183 TaxID=3240006 RepID=UPI003D8F5B1E
MPSQEAARHVEARTWTTPGKGAGAGPAAPLPDLVTYRAAVADLLPAVAAWTGPADLPALEAALTGRLTRPEFSAVLAALPGGAVEVARQLVLEVADRRTDGPARAPDVAELIRIYLLSRIDVMWWGRLPGYATDAELHNSADLVDVEALGRGGLLRFRYRRRAGGMLTRTLRTVERRVWPHRAPYTSGLRFARTRPEVVALLNQLAVDLAQRGTGPTPPLWVTSLARSVEHQHRLRALGQAAMLPSGHCTGHAVDIEMSWFRRFDAHGTLAALLLERQGWGDVNVIDEDQFWHVCVSPRGAGRLRRDFQTAMGG